MITGLFDPFLTYQYPICNKRKRLLPIARLDSKKTQVLKVVHCSKTMESLLYKLGVTLCIAVAPPYLDHK